MKENKNEMDALIKRFFDADEAARMAEEIRQADNLLASLPGPRMSLDVKNAIRDRVQRQLLAKAAGKAYRFRMRVGLSAAAAAVLLAAGVTFITPNNRSFDPAIWDETPVSTLATSIETVANQINTMQDQNTKWFDDESGIYSEIDTIETKASETDFWKA